MKKERALILNAAFIKVFDEELKSVGFQRIKGKHPYYVRLINEEILHVITCTTEDLGFREKKSFQIYGGVATVYRDNIDLSISPDDNKDWLETNHLLYIRDKSKNVDIKFDNDTYFLYDRDNTDSMLSELKKAFDITKHVLIPYLDKIQNIDSCINHFFKLSGRVYAFSDYFEGLIFLKTDNYSKLIEENILFHRAIYKKNVELMKKGFTQEEYEKRCQRHDLVLKRETKPIDDIISSPELYEKYNDELQHRKTQNIETLRSYGLTI